MGSSGNLRPTVRDLKQNKQGKFWRSRFFYRPPIIVVFVGATIGFRFVPLFWTHINRGQLAATHVGYMFHHPIKKVPKNVDFPIPLI